MITDSSLQKSLMAASHLGEHRFLLNLGSFILYLDIVLSLQYSLPLNAMSHDWATRNITLGGAVMFLLSYVFLRAFVLPALLWLYTAIFWPPLFFLGFKAGAFKTRVPERDWLEYSILTRNTPAYRELESKRERDRLGIEQARASFALAILVVANVVLGSRQSVAAHCLELLEHSPFPVACLGAIALGLFGSLLLAGGFIAPLFMSAGLQIKAGTLRDEIKRVLKGGSEL